MKVRLERMRQQGDTDTVFTFTPGAGAWYLTVGARTRDNGSIFDNYEFSNRGMYVRIENFLGTRATFYRWGPDSWFDNVGTTSTGLPAWVAGTAYRLRFRVRGQQLFLRVWAAASPEPATWNLTATDPQAWTEPGKVTIARATNLSGDLSSVDIDDITVLGLDPILPTIGEDTPRHSWTMWSRAANYSPDLSLPISSIKGVKRHMGVGRVVAETAFTPERWASLQPSRGLVIYRAGRQMFTGYLVARQFDWDAENGRAVIKVEAEGDEGNLSTVPVFPDPLRAPADQTVNDYWTYTGLASTAMRRLISDQAGPTCRADRRIPGLVLGADPGVGLSRKWTGLFAADGGTLGTLARMSVASGENLGLRFTSAAGSLTVDIVEPRDLASQVRFSADMRNLVGFTYREQAPTVTDVLSHGQGDLHARLRRYKATVAPLVLAWGRRIWANIDRRDTADVAELDKANDDTLAESEPTISLTVVLSDSEAATYGVWDLGDKVTVYVGLPGQAKVATVVDVVREIAFEVNEKGIEKLAPAIGTYDAKAVLATPTQQQLAAIGAALSNLIARQ